jgi:Fis family transcriptional regulator
MSQAPSAHPPRFKDRIEILCAEMAERGIRFSEAMQQFEHCFIQTVLKRQDGHLSLAARELGIHRNTLARKVAKEGAGRRKRKR